MSRLRSTLVREEALAQLAKDFSLGEFLILGQGELKSGGARRSSILADAMEAIIGAIFLDSNFETCRQVVLTWYQSRLDESSLHDENKDAKTILQEYLQAKKIDLPKYEIADVVGEAHQQQFYINCVIPKLKIQAQGVGGSRRKAEQAAAELILEKIKKCKA